MMPAPTTALYQVVFTGNLGPLAVRLQSKVRELLTHLGLPSDTIAFLRDPVAGSWNPKLPVMGIYFGGPFPLLTPAAQALLPESAVIIPVVSDLTGVHSSLPSGLQHINALEVKPDGTGLTRLGSLVLETFRLLRRERRLFISYRRKDSQALANRLYDEFDSRGYDVFIDIRSVPPGVDFQEELWHRMGDADLVILIDTPGFRTSRWTTDELAQANLTNLQILHLLWPGQQEDATSAFSEFMPLNKSDFRNGVPGRGYSIKRDVVERICIRAEELRARAIKLRHRYLVDSFCDAAADLGISAHVQALRWISVPALAGKPIAVVPAIGRPTSDRIHEIFDEIRRSAEEFEAVWIIYDGRGVRPDWKKHLDWLDSHLPVRTMALASAISALGGHVS